MEGCREWLSGATIIAWYARSRSLRTGRGLACSLLAGQPLPGQRHPPGSTARWCRPPNRRHRGCCTAPTSNGSQVPAAAPPSARRARRGSLAAPRAPPQPGVLRLPGALTLHSWGHPYHPRRSPRRHPAARPPLQGRTVARAWPSRLSRRRRTSADTVAAAPARRRGRRGGSACKR